MLELIQQEDWHGLTVYVAVRVAIVLICWVFLAMATFIDMYYGRKAAKAAGEWKSHATLTPLAKQDCPPLATI